MINFKTAIFSTLTAVALLASTSANALDYYQQQQLNYQQQMLQQQQQQTQIMQQQQQQMQNQQLQQSLQNQGQLLTPRSLPAPSFQTYR